VEFEFLSPIEPAIIDFALQLSTKQLGFTIVKNQINNFPNLQGINLAIIGVLDNRNIEHAYPDIDLTHIRKEFYQLYPGNWTESLADLGDINPGETSEDTFFALRIIAERLIKLNIIPMVIGGSQDLTYPMYRAFDNLDQMVNLVCIDSKFDFGKVEDPIKADSYLARIIADEPNNLFNYANIGFQTYFNAMEEINLIEKLYFEAYRLGEVSKNIGLAEPVLRDSDIVSIDLASIKSSDSGNFTTFMPNGFDGKEICSLARYAGISNKIKALGIFNHTSSKNEATIISQILWYFIEGFVFRTAEDVYQDKNQLIKYIVLVDDQDIIFYKSNQTERWWMEIPLITNYNNIIQRTSLLPCTQEEYLNCCNQEIPERWWKSQRKNSM